MIVQCFAETCAKTAILRSFAAKVVQTPRNNKRLSRKDCSLDKLNQGKSEKTAKSAISRKQSAIPRKQSEIQQTQINLSKSLLERNKALLLPHKPQTTNQYVGIHPLFLRLLLLLCPTSKAGCRVPTLVKETYFESPASSRGGISF